MEKLCKSMGSSNKLLNQATSCQHGPIISMGSYNDHCFLFLRTRHFHWYCRTITLQGDTHNSLLSCLSNSESLKKRPKGSNVKSISHPTSSNTSTLCSQNLSDSRPLTLFFTSSPLQTLYICSTSEFPSKNSTTQFISYLLQKVPTNVGSPPLSQRYIWAILSKTLCFFFPNLVC